ncbi:hypothetical protein NQ317_000479 [Molorchus minor]|uniref:Adenosine kinase n=1 Tax=Molorchus minor TaxID=1323400 RepID=A0ABQ9ISC0_9CUCU|nr:hypothetical protein NQ317_000479 [Molorchus minor]
MALPKDKVVDTNGAGDAFVGGFLSQYIQGQNIDICIKCATWAAAEIIQRSGCTFDGSPGEPVNHMKLEVVLALTSAGRKPK